MRAAFPNFPRLLLFSLLWAAIPVQGQAADVPRLRLGKGAGRALAVRVQVANGASRLRVGGLSETLPEGEAGPPSIESIELSGGVRVGLVRVSVAERKLVYLVALKSGRPRLLWQGRTDMHGDRGERRGHAVELGDRDGDGTTDLIVGERHEQAALCDGRLPLLSPQALDPARLTLRAVSLDPMAASQTPTNPSVVTASLQSPGPKGPPTLGRLRALGASSAADPTAVSPSRAADGNPATYWQESRGVGGRGEFIRYRRPVGGWPIRAVAITPSPSDAELARRLARPRSLRLVGDRGEILAVQLAADPAEHPGAAFWVVPPQPLDWACFTLIVDRVAGVAQSGTPVALADVAAYTELDFEGGQQRLVEMIEKGHPAAPAAVDALSQGDQDVSQALREAWPRMDALARRRAVRVWARRAAREEPARDALLLAVSEGDADVSRAAREGLQQAGESGALALLSLVATPGELGDAVAVALARARPDLSTTTILEAMASEGGSERPALREALRTSVNRARGKALDGLATQLAEPLSVSAEAGVALSLASLEPARPLVQRLLARNLERAAEFPELWRLSLAAAELPSEAQVDSWLAQLAESDTRWMLRARALRSLSARQAAQTASIAQTLSADDYPRVRVAAVEVLGSRPGSLGTVRARALGDRWSLVRAAALDSLPHEGQLPTFREAMGDKVSRVRAAALRGLVRGEDRASAALVMARLKDREEWPAVQQEALRFVSRVCLGEAGESLFDIVKRGMAPNAWEPHVDLGLQALEVLGELGGASADSAFALAASHPGGFRDTAAQARKVAKPCAKHP